MIIGKVTGTYVSTQKNDQLHDKKILIVQPITPEGTITGQEVLAVDVVDAGIGDRVLLLSEGTAARQIFGNDKIPVHTVIVAVVDDLDETK
jgi:microcompartment protein CcmK/EutM